MPDEKIVNSNEEEKLPIGPPLKVLEYKTISRGFDGGQQQF